MPLNLAEIFDGTKSVCIGENHAAISPKRFLIDNFKDFKASGYDVLFLEHFSRVEHQPLIDEYYQTGIMPRGLEKKCKDMNEGHMDPWGYGEKYKEYVKSYNFLTLIEKARENNIRTVCLEKSESEYRATKDRKKRICEFNKRACEVITRECESYQGLKWIALVGTVHVNTALMRDEEGGALEVRGIAEKSGVHDFFVFGQDSSSELFCEIKSCALNFSPKGRISMDNEYYNYEKSKEFHDTISREGFEEAIFYKELSFDSFFVSKMVVLDYEKSLKISDIRLDLFFDTHEEFIAAKKKSLEREALKLEKKKASADSSDFTAFASSAAMSDLPDSRFTIYKRPAAGQEEPFAKKAATEDKNLDGRENK